MSELLKPEGSNGVVIWKFTIGPGEEPIRMPEGSRILAVGQQQGDVVVWAACDPHALPEWRHLTIEGTGGGFGRAARIYHGTVQMPNGLVWHVVEAVVHA